MCFMLGRKIFPELTLIPFSRAAVTALKAKQLTEHKTPRWPQTLTLHFTAATLYILTLLSVIGNIFQSFRETLDWSRIYNLTHWGSKLHWLLHKVETSSTGQHAGCFLQLIHNKNPGLPYCVSVQNSTSEYTKQLPSCWGTPACAC